MAARRALTNLVKLKELYEEWGRGDFSREDIFDPEVEHRSQGFPEGPADARGLEQLRERMRHWFRAWEHPTLVEADEFTEAGERILVMIRWKGRGKESGMPMEGEGAHLWTFREGSAVRFDVYRDRAEALAALDDE